MAQVVVRKLESHVLERLKRRAKRANKPLEQSLREILSKAAGPDPAEALARVRQFRSNLPYIDLDATDLIREDRDR